jgi:hypothetical protein
VRALLTPCLDPQIKYVMKIDVRQERRSTSRLNTRPVRSPVNASTPPLRAAPHDSGPMWVANPLSYDFCIHYTSPV